MPCGGRGAARSSTSGCWARAMGLFSAGDIDIAGAQAEYQGWLIDGERVLAAFRTVRDTALLTNLRFIFVDVQGLTGSKKEFLSIPWRSVTRFSFETAGTFDQVGRAPV